ncbi:hypothetical protein [Mucilaginibacter auburnensis]|uniref:Lipoprotein n=1 Tax=Mucilaginibacter auburnensis TaxID=1457233 RepID=A0A2H9VQH1_9SPHI|nr:hypothetical protein [Mucilaginibacter auburnensis]PJJ83071.1 hypothetical protein CLV57_0048 [Mucilaginibacter auburnensis]
MKNYLSLSLLLFWASMIVVSCTKTGTSPNGTDQSSNNNNNTPATTESPYFEYSIGADAAVRVDCSDIAFSAKPGDVMVAVYANFVNTKASFLFAFPASATAVQAAVTGSYPVSAYSSFTNPASLKAFELSLRAPKTIGGTDYFYSVAPTNATYENKIKSIAKGAIEGTKQVYWIEGEFKMPAENVAKQTTTLSGKYRFKLLTL